LEAEAARFDGKSWSAAKAGDVPDAAATQWQFRQLRAVGKGYRDKTQGNYLCGPVAGGAEIKPRYYLKEVFFPLYLGAGADGRRLWISTFTGLVRLELSKPEGK
jgi:hypothetical protein